MARDRAVVEAALQKKGFKKDDSHHHFFIYWNRDGKKTSRKTKTSHGSSYKVLGDPLLKQMARQVGLTKPKFLELVDCSLDQEGYEKEVGHS